MSSRDRTALDPRTLAAAQADSVLAIREFDDARARLARMTGGPMTPLAAEVRLYDQNLEQVLLVKHRWREWVPPGGSVESRETPREAAVREVREETGLQVSTLEFPAAVTVPYRRGWTATFGLSYAAIVDMPAPLHPEKGQLVAWTSLDAEWRCSSGEDPSRMRWHARWLRENAS